MRRRPFGGHFLRGFQRLPGAKVRQRHRSPSPWEAATATALGSALGSMAGALPPGAELGCEPSVTLEGEDGAVVMAQAPPG